MSPVRLVVVVYQSVLLALSQIWSNKARSVLTTLGIVIGVASVTVVIASLTGLKANVLGQFESFGTNKVYIFPDRPNSGPLAGLSWRLINFKPDEFDGLLRNCPSVTAISRYTDRRRDVSYGDQTRRMRMAGIDPSWHSVENRGVLKGRPFNLVDEEQARPVCLIDAETAADLKMNRDPTGEDLLVEGRRFRVIGVIEAENKVSFGDTGGRTTSLYVPFQTLYNLDPDPRDFLYAVAAAKSADVAEEAASEARFFLRNRRGLKPGEPDTFRVEIIERMVQEFQTMASAVTLVASAVVGISLIVGGVGIMNIMLVSVSERTREIGLRKAVGALPVVVLIQFLIEAIVLCLCGGIVGILIGQVMTWGVAKIPGANLEKAYIPGWAIAVSFGFSAAVGLIFGMFPALKASRLDPIEALRHE